MQKDYYQILAVIDTAEIAIIKATYKTLIHIYHPDRYEGDKDEAHQKTKDILEAYRVLSNPELREEYDKLRQTKKASTTEVSQPTAIRVPRFDPVSLSPSLTTDSSSSLANVSDTLLRKLAREGDTEAQIVLGRKLFKGETGFQQNHTESFEWFKKAADLDNTVAQGIVGFLYANGIGVEHSDIKAFLWFKRAALQGCQDAKFRLGLCFYTGFGVQQDYQVAINWLNESAVEGNSNAQYLLGFMMANGDGIAKDVNQGRSWLQQSAASGNIAAIEELKAIDHNL